jgi:hypothetical protein
MRIDVHAHYWTDDYIDLLVDLGQAGAVMARGIGAGGGAELAARLRLMDRAWVEMQVLSACPQLPYGQDGQKTAGRPGSSATSTPTWSSAARTASVPSPRCRCPTSRSPSAKWAGLWTIRVWPGWR